MPQSGQLPGTLSSGQRRRLALATAFVRPRKLLILDEPEQRLDTEGVAWLAGGSRPSGSRGLAIVFASHEPTLVEQVATRVVGLGGGMSTLTTATRVQPSRGRPIPQRRRPVSPAGGDAFPPAGGDVSPSRDADPEYPAHHDAGFEVRGALTRGPVRRGAQGTDPRLAQGPGDPQPHGGVQRRVRRA